MSGLAVTAIIAGGVLKAYSALAEGKIAYAQGQFAKQIGQRNLEAARVNKRNIEAASEANQRALDRQAKSEREVAALEEERAARKEKLVKAAQRAASGKSGVGLAGASLSALTDTAFQFSLERNLILRAGLIRFTELRFRGRMELYKGKVLGARELFRGQLSYAQGKWQAELGIQARKLSYVNAAASILGSAGTASLLGSMNPPGTTTTASTAGTVPAGASATPGFGTPTPYGS